MISFLAENCITPILPIVLTLTALFFWIILKGFPVFRLKAVLSSLFDKHNSTSSLRALSVALAGTLGVGNIIGIAYAVKEGGAGAVLWLWISAFLAMILKYAETLLATCKRTVVREGNGTRFVGGPMYYIPNRFFAVLFAILCVFSSFTVGNLLQISAVGEAIRHTLPIPSHLIGILFALLTYVIIRKGISRITDFCAAVIPFLSAVYLLMCLAVMIKGHSLLPSVFSDIFREAFSEKAVGAALPVGILQSIRIGFSRGLITNEAGCGTAPIAHASAETDSAVKQGFLGMVEVFFDTVVLCSASALVFLITLKQNPSLSGYALVESAFFSVFGKIGSILLPISLFVFVLATLVGWSFYGKSALEFLTKKRGFQALYLLLFSVCAFFGAIGSIDVFWDLSDISLGIMTVINLVSLLVFSREIKEETESFFKKQNR